MSELDDIDEQTIREAPPEQINRWIAQERGRVYEMYSGEIRYEWSRAGCPGLLEHGETERPIPYCSAWWAAGPLLDELQALIDAEPMQGKPLITTDGKWSVVSVFNGDGVRPVGTDIPEAIARAYLLAAHRGLLEGDDE